MVALPQAGQGYQSSQPHFSKSSASVKGISTHFSTIPESTGASMQSPAFAVFQGLAFWWLLKGSCDSVYPRITKVGMDLWRSSAPVHCSKQTKLPRFHSRFWALSC